MPRPNLNELNGDKLVLGRYRLVGSEPLGEGGWCVVWEAEDTTTTPDNSAYPKRVAVKTFRDQILRDVDPGTLAARFAKEVETFDTLGLSRFHAARCRHLSRRGFVGQLDPQQLFVNLLDFSTHSGHGARYQAERGPSETEFSSSIGGSAGRQGRSSSSTSELPPSEPRTGSSGMQTNSQGATTDPGRPSQEPLLGPPRQSSALVPRPKPGKSKDGRYYLVLELAVETLEEWIQHRAESRDFVRLEEVRSVTATLAAGLAWLHSHGLCHLDIKPANIMRFGDGSWKLIDLEGTVPMWCTSKSSQLRLDGFTPLYTCPELAGAVLEDEAVLRGSTLALTGIAPSSKMDTWGAGVVILDMLAHESAFEEVRSGMAMQAMMCMDMEEDVDGIAVWEQTWYRWLVEPEPIAAEAYLTSLSSSAKLLQRCPELQDLLDRLLAKEPKFRLTAREVLEHPFLLLEREDSAAKLLEVEEPMMARRPEVEEAAISSGRCHFSRLCCITVA
mmetsp:Transcript_115029/g.229018  ORF Transcript_115029/g.229018 Transcript_115029/m.229018 type:complete len:501 (+) Transcript_115029:103-1605(+)